MTQVPTVFEKIMRGELPGVILYEDELVCAIMDAGQLNPGHVLVVSRAPYETLMDADDETAAAMMRVAARIARAVERAFQPEGVTILQANRTAGWQTVPHLHLHVVPRYQGDGVELTWPRKDPGLEKLREYAAKIGKV